MAKRCIEELDELRRILETYIDGRLLVFTHHHLCDEHRLSVYCAPLPKEEEAAEANRRKLEEAVDALAECLGRIVHE